MGMGQVTNHLEMGRFSSHPAEQNPTLVDVHSRVPGALDQSHLLLFPHQNGYFGSAYLEYM